MAVQTEQTILFGLNLVSMLILFRFLLGCGFSKTRSSVIIAAVLAAALYVFSIQWPDPLQMKLDKIQYGIPFQIVDFSEILAACIPAVLLKGKRLNLFLIGLAWERFHWIVLFSSSDIMMIILKGEVNLEDFSFYYMITIIVVIILLFITAFCLRRYRDIFYDIINHTNPTVFLVYILFVNGLGWEWSLISSEDIDTEMLYQGANGLKDDITGLLATVFMFVVIFMMYQRQRLNEEITLKERCIEEQAEQYEFMGRANRRSRKFRHDFNKHIEVLSDLADRKNYEELRNYIHKMAEAKENTYYITTGSMVADAIINRYYVKCRESGIMLKCSGSFPDGMQIEATDLCVILSNGLENAWEAACQCRSGREIQVSIGNRKNLIFITIRNPSSTPPAIEGDIIRTSKSDRENHGLGTGNMQEAARRSGGHIKWRYDAQQGDVVTKICLKNEKNGNK